jgi:hypothetical protein
MAAGVRQRHGLNCNRKGRCHCPWEASVYSKRDAKKIRKTFPTKAAAVTWRDDSRSAVRKGSMSAPTASRSARRQMRGLHEPVPAPA